MSFKFPEEYRLTKEKAKSWTHISQGILDLVSDSSRKEDGFFAIPAQGKRFGMMYLVRATVVGGYRMVSINIPSQGRSATWEEQHYIKNLFWEKNIPVIAVHPGEPVYVGGNKFWINLWQPVNLTEKEYIRLLPPIYEASHPFRKAGFWTQFFRAVKKALGIKKVVYDR